MMGESRVGMRWSGICLLGLGFIVLTGCSDSGSESDAQQSAPAYDSVQEACADIRKALGNVPTDAPSITSEGLNGWADEMQPFVDDMDSVAQRLESTDALAHSVVVEIVGTTQTAIDKTRDSASDPSESNISEMNEAIVDAGSALEAIGPICS